MTPLLRCLLVATGYAAAGELARRRPSRSLVAWNESFWIGAALFTAALVLGSSTKLPVLGVLFPILPAAIVAVVLRRAAGFSRRSGDRPLRSPGRGARLPLALAFLSASVFVALDMRTGFVTDGFGIWASKARVLAVEGRLDPADAMPQRLGRVVNYPPLVPLTEALIGRQGRELDFPAAKLAFPAFFLSLLVGTWGLARRALGSDEAAGWTVAIVALLPAVSTDWNAGGFADLPMAAAVAAMAGAWLHAREIRGEGAVPAWVAGAVILVKPEGIVLAASAVLAASLAGRAVPRRLRPAPWWVLAGFALVALYWRKRYGMEDGQYGPLDAAHWSVAAQRVGLVAGKAAVEMASGKNWGLFWLVALPSAVLGSFAAREPVRSLARFVLVSASALTAIFLFSNWGFPGSGAYGAQSLSFHIAVALPRLLEQIAAPAALLVVASYRAMGARGSPGAAENGAGSLAL